MIHLTRDDGEVFQLDGAQMGLTSLEGLDAPSVELFTEKRAVGDGDVITGQRLSSRLITLSARARNASLNEALRTRASRFFNPQHAFDVRVTYQNSIRTARECCLKALSLPTGNVYEPLSLKASLLCPRPLLDDGLNHALTLTSAASPLELLNPGDAPAWLRITLKADAERTVLNPTLMVGGATVRILTALSSGDELTLDAERLTLRLNGVNALHLLDPTCRLSDARLPTGGCALSLTADESADALRARVTYRVEYLGI